MRQKKPGKVLQLASLDTNIITLLLMERYVSPDESESQRAETFKFNRS